MGKIIYHFGRKSNHFSISERMVGVAIFYSIDIKGSPAW